MTPPSLMQLIGAMSAMDGLRVGLLLTLVLSIVCGFLCLWILKRKFKEFFATKSFRSSLKHYFGHVPEQNDTPWLHLFLLLTVVLSVSAAAGLSIIGEVRRLPDALALELSIVGFVFTCSSACVTFWTLWQTHRIEYHTGYRIVGFRELIVELTRQLQLMEEQVKTSSKAGQRQTHRVLFIAPQPFFGMLSFGWNDNLYQNYEDALSRVAKLRRRHREFVFGIICVDTIGLRTFHKDYQQGRSQEWLDESVEAAEKAIVRITEAAGDGCEVFTRYHSTPGTEFVVIGNRVYSFAIEAVSGQSEIHETDVKEDRRNADRHARTFKLIGDLMSSKPEAN